MTQPAYATPEEAGQAFYDAFQRADLAAMMSVWANREFIECIHPMSGRLRGPGAIEGSWRMVLHHTSPSPDRTESDGAGTAGSPPDKPKLH